MKDAENSQWIEAVDRMPDAHRHDQLDVLGLLAAVHLALDVRMIGPLLKRIGRRDTPYPMRLGYIVDVLLFIGMAVILVTGVGTSATIFTQVQLPRRRFFMDLHTYVSNITMLLMLGHLWLHKGWLRGMLRMTCLLYTSDAADEL